MTSLRRWPCLILFPLALQIHVLAQAQPSAGDKSTGSQDRAADAAKDSNAEKAYRVGGAVSPPKPIYTPDPARRGKNGLVVLWLIVTPDGKTRDIKVARSLDPKSDRSAVEAVEKWTFEPALKDGKPVAVQINVQIQFKAHDFFGTQERSP